MAHKYSTFDSAYAAFTYKWYDIKEWIDLSYDRLAEAYAETDDPPTLATFRTAIGGATGLNWCIKEIIDYNATYYNKSYFFESIYWANKDQPDPPEFELTWIKICEAWAVNDFEGRAVTIAFIDRMRQLIWDEPFYVAWAARPENSE